MNSSVQLLETTGCALRDALEQRDWSVIGELDLQCRQAVSEAMKDGTDEALLRERLQELLGLYRELVALCRDEQQRLASELVQLNQAREGAKVYQLFN